MKKNKYLSITLTAIACVFSFSAPAFSQTQTVVAPEVIPPMPTAADFAKANAKSFAISPDGKAIAYILPYGVASKVAILNLETNKIITANLGSDVKTRRVFWGNNKYVFADVSMTGAVGKADANAKNMREFYRTISIARDGSTTAILLSNTELKYNSRFPIEHSRLDDEDSALLGARVLDDTFGSTGRIDKLENINFVRYAIYKVDLRTGLGKEHEHGTGETSDWGLDAKGNAILRIDSNDTAKTETYFVRNGNNWNKLKEFKISDKEPTYVLNGIIDSTKALLIDTKSEVQKAYFLNLTNGDLTEAFPEEKRSVSSVTLDPITRQPVRIFFEAYDLQQRWLDEGSAKMQAALNNTFKGKEVLIASRSADKTKMLVSVEDGSSLPKTYLFDSVRNTAESLIDPIASIENYKLGSRTLKEFKARDGQIVPVIITEPAYKKMVNRPAIVLPHGGPQAQDSTGYDDFSQFLASRGYVVIQPQFRGSEGKGKAWEKAGHGEWGGKMQDDVSDAVLWAISNGWVDKNRVCIAGASYGGYAALAGATITPELYACAISLAGVSDLGTMQAYANSMTSSLSYWEKHMGLTRFDTEKIRAKSPAYLAKNVRGPILLIHGKDDTVVPLIQSRQMAKALKEAGKPYEIIELEGEDHWLSREPTRARFFAEMERFLKPILKPEM